MSDNPFASPVEASTANSPTPNLDAVKLVRPIGIALLVGSILAIGMDLMGVVYSSPMLDHPNPNGRETAQLLLVAAGLNIGLSIAALSGAVCMLIRRARWLAIIGAWAAVVPFPGACCCFLTPVGVWATLALSKPEVAAAFRNA